MLKCQKMRLKSGFVLLLIAFSASSFAQRFPEHDADAEPRNKGKLISLHFSLGAHLPGGDMASRFGTSGAFGGGIEFMTDNSFFIGADIQAIYGGNVKEDPLAILRTPDGYIIGNDRAIASVALRERGIYYGGSIGKLFPVKGTRKGLRFSVGGGWMQHRIKLQDNRSVLTQITGDYGKGYDRLTGGFALNQFIGWQQLGDQRRSNWLIGLELMQGFTETRRDWDFNDKMKLSGSRLDLLIGIKAAWTLPFYQTPGGEIVY